MFRFLFFTGNWPPRWRCGTWSDALGYVHITSELMIFAAYMAIPLLLVYFLRKRKDVPFSGIFWLFAAFIIACGFTHLTEAIIFYYPVYRFLGLLLVLTALVSWVTVIALIPVLPKLLALPGLQNINELLKKDYGQAKLRYDTALELVQVGVWEWDLKAQQCVLSANAQALLELSGSSSMADDHFFSQIHFEELKKFEAELQENLQSTHHQSLRLRCMVGGKKVESFLFHWKTIFDEKQNPLKVIGTIAR
ncbi:MAG: hypothetical protein SP1CHLAM54_00060 [Chlamydiia bacterium]|nr:hypothetical protein [Chlamydiia bacterium]